MENNPIMKTFFSGREAEIKAECEKSMADKTPYVIVFESKIVARVAGKHAAHEEWLRRRYDGEMCDMLTEGDWRRRNGE